MHIQRATWGAVYLPARTAPPAVRAPVRSCFGARTSGTGERRPPSVCCRYVGVLWVSCGCPVGVLWVQYSPPSPSPLSSPAKVLPAIGQSLQDHVCVPVLAVGNWATARSGGSGRGGGEELPPQPRTRTFAAASSSSSSGGSVGGVGVGGALLLLWTLLWDLLLLRWWAKHAKPYFHQLSTLPLPPNGTYLQACVRPWLRAEMVLFQQQWANQSLVPTHTPPHTHTTTSTTHTHAHTPLQAFTAGSCWTPPGRPSRLTARRSPRRSCCSAMGKSRAG